MLLIRRGVPNGLLKKMAGSALSFARREEEERINMNSQPVILNVEEVSKWLRIPLSTLYGMCRRGEIPCIKIGKHWRFEQKRIETWIENKISENGPHSRN